MVVNDLVLAKQFVFGKTRCTEDLSEDMNTGHLSSVNLNLGNAEFFGRRRFNSTSCLIFGIRIRIRNTCVCKLTKKYLNLEMVSRVHGFSLV